MQSDMVKIPHRRYSGNWDLKDSDCLWRREAGSFERAFIKPKMIKRSIMQQWTFNTAKSFTEGLFKA